MNRVEELQKKLKDAEAAQKTAKITSNRGRLINEIRREIARIKENGVTPEEANDLRKLEELLEENITQHKAQLNERYKEEFVKKSGSILSTITVLPKGVALAISKIKTCIGNIKDAKDNKERTFKIVETLKSAGVLAATPFIFTGKFLIKHWYLVLLFITYIFNLPGILFKAGKDTVLQNAEAEIKNKAGGFAKSIGIDKLGVPIEEAEKTTFWQEISKRLTDPQELQQIGQEAKERALNLGTTVKNDIKAVKDAIQFIRQNFGLINNYIKSNYGVDLEGLNGEVKNKLKAIQEKIHNLTITNPDVMKEAREINQEMREVASLLSQQPAIDTGMLM